MNSTFLPLLQQIIAKYYKIPYFAIIFYYNYFKKVFYNKEGGYQIQTCEP